MSFDRLRVGANAAERYSCRGLRLKLGAARLAARSRPKFVQRRSGLRGDVVRAQLPRHGRVNGLAMTQEVCLRRDESLERRVDVEENHVGDEAVDAGVDAAWLRAE